MFAGGTPDRVNPDFWTDGDVPWLNSGSVNDWAITAPSELITRQALAKGATRWAPKGSVLVALAGQGKTKGMAARLEIDSTLNQSLAAIVPGDTVEYRFLHYWLTSNYQNLRGLAGGDLRDGLNLQHLSAVQIPRPDFAEQRAIADYLDRETAQIDAFIAKNEELIALLTERRAAVVARAVLRGTNPNAELRNSGVAWLGHVPSHWKVSRLSRWFSVTLGKMLDEAKFAGTIGELLRYLRASNIKANRLDLGDVKSMPFTPAEQSKFSLRAGDLVVVEGGSIGVNAHIDEDMDGWGFQKTVNRVRSLRGDLTRFLGYQLDVIREAGVLNMIANVSTIQHLTAEKLERLVVAMPPAEEQKAIVRHINQSTSVIDRAIQTAEQVVGLARERRAALISAAVTGKIDVGVAA